MMSKVASVGGREVSAFRNDGVVLARSRERDLAMFGRALSPPGLPELGSWLDDWPGGRILGEDGLGD